MRWWVRLLFEVGAPLALCPLLIDSSPQWRCAFVVLLMAVYWTLELVPLAVTSLFPVFLFPLLGILDTNRTSSLYLKGTNMMYLGSLVMALAVEESGLHRRIALKALMLAGTGISRIMIGFMIPTAFLSMWISNAATAAMMLPIMEAVLEQLKLEKSLRTMMLLCIAYSCNVGGTGTIIGTPPNMILMEFLQQYTDHPLNFGSWIVFSLPLVAVDLVLVWAILQLYFRVIKKEKGKKEEDKAEEVGVQEVIKEKYISLGTMKAQEIIVLCLFTVLVLVWFTRKPGFMPGWANQLQYKQQDTVVTISSASPTILIITLLFIIPRDPLNNPDGGTLLNWNQVQKKFPWGIILLMGGGFALAEGAKASCLTSLIGSHLSSLHTMPIPVVLVVLCLVTSVVSQIASNSATTAMVIPVVLSMASQLQVNPLYFALGVTLTASNAFMLPVSTPCNAIVYTAGGIRVLDMVVVGLMLNTACLCVTLLGLHSHGSLLFQLNELPVWANQSISTQQDCLL